MILRNALPLLLPILLGTAIGCVDRTMQVNSRPQGALVYLNNQEVGRTPLKRDFVWYGNYDVQVRREGYQTLNTNKWVVAPWWQWPPFDLFAEILPFRLRDQRTITFNLEPASTQPADSQQMLSRAERMRAQLQSSRFTRTPVPATQASR